MQEPLPFREDALKKCVACGELKPLSEFHRHRGKRDGRQARCKPCNIELNIRYYAEHPEQRRAAIKARADRMKAANRVALFEYLLAHPCVDCGEADPVVLEFDHLRDKVFNISEIANRPVRWAVVLMEIAKCDVVCANCHRRRTCERLDSARVRLLRSMGVSAEESR